VRGDRRPQDLGRRSGEGRSARESGRDRVHDRELASRHRSDDRAGATRRGHRPREHGRRALCESPPRRVPDVGLRHRPDTVGAVRGSRRADDGVSRRGRGELRRLDHVAPFGPGPRTGDRGRGRPAVRSTGRPDRDRGEHAPTRCQGSSARNPRVDLLRRARLPGERNGRASARR
jgi:hypothetical protein